MNDEISKLKQYLIQLDSVKPNQIEAVSSRIYFREYSKLIDSRFEFKSRNSPLRVKKDIGQLMSLMPVSLDYFKKVGL